MESKFDQYQKLILDTYKLREIRERDAFSKLIKKNLGLEVVFLYDEAAATDEDDMEYIRKEYGEKAFSDDNYDSSEDIDMLSCIMNGQYFVVVFSSEPLEGGGTVRNVIKIGDENAYFCLNLINDSLLAVPEELIAKYLRIYYSRLRKISVQDILEN